MTARESTGNCVIVQKAIEKDVITAEQAAHLSDQEALELIFRPGLLHQGTGDGSLRTRSRHGCREGNHRQAARPSLDRDHSRPRHAHRDGVSAHTGRASGALPAGSPGVYALPISAIDSLTDLEEHRVHRLAGRVTYRVDGTRTVPVVDLGAILQHRPLRLGRESVEGVLTERGLFVVSEVLGNEDSVVKPIDFLAGPSLYQGATISGRGNVVLILDAAALSAAAAAGGRRALMDIQRIMQIMDASSRTRRIIERSLHEIDRRALNAMVLVKRHGNKLASYGVVAQAFREQAVQSEKCRGSAAAIGRAAGPGAVAHFAARPLYAKCSAAPRR